MHTSKQLQRFYDEASSQLATPYMLVDTESIRQQCRVFKQKLPNVKLYYAVKCFGDNEVIRAVDDLVDGYDVASVTEIRALKALGIESSRMTYSNPVKSEQDIVEAAALGVNNMAFQSEGELEKIARVAPGSRVYLRVRVADDLSSISFSSKFGAIKEKAIELLLVAKQRGLTPEGVTFHVGSQADDQSVWGSAIDVCVAIIEECSEKGIDLSLVNLGGGFPVQYTEEDPSFDTVVANVAPAIKRVENMKLIAEPGRFIVADSSVIVTTIIGVEERNDVTWLFLDTGTFQSFIEVFEFGYFPYPVYSLKHAGKQSVTKQYVLTGPSCDSYDTMTQSIELPEDLVLGDKLVIGMTGAYTVVYGSNFNGFNVPKRVFLN